MNSPTRRPSLLASIFDRLRPRPGGTLPSASIVEAPQVRRALDAIKVQQATARTPRSAAIAEASKTGFKKKKTGFAAMTKEQHLAASRKGAAATNAIGPRGKPRP